MANFLKRGKKVAVLKALTEGCSVRSTERMFGIHRDTIIRLMVRVGRGCKLLLDEMMVDLDCTRVQVDEIWGYVGKKQRHVTTDDDIRLVGDQWVYVAIDADTKLIPSYLVGKRNALNTRTFISDLASRMKNRIQLSSDGLQQYVDAVDTGFGWQAADYGMIIKVFEAEPIGPGRYSPPKVIDTKKTVIVGTPDPDHISTSYVERQNLTMRMQIRRLTRLTNAFSKKLENHRSAVALHFAHYDLARVHQTLRVTPAMEAGVQDHVWSMEELMDAALQKAA